MAARRRTLHVMPEPLPCPRHPEVETRLRCSGCASPICPGCGREAAVGYKCPECARHLDGTLAARSGTRAGGLAGWFTGRDAGTARPPARPSPGERLSPTLAARSLAYGLGAAVLGGLVLSVVLQGGFLLLVSAGVIGWAVARAVYLGSQETDSPFVRAVALTLAGFTVAIALAIAGFSTAPAGLLFLAYPAAVYGGWIVVRGR